MIKLLKVLLTLFVVFNVALPTDVKAASDDIDTKDGCKQAGFSWRLLQNHCGLAKKDCDKLPLRYWASYSGPQYKETDPEARNGKCALRTTSTDMPGSDEGPSLRDKRECEAVGGTYKGSGTLEQNCILTKSQCDQISSRQWVPDDASGLDPSSTKGQCLLKRLPTEAVAESQKQPNINALGLGFFGGNVNIADQKIGSCPSSAAAIGKSLAVSIPPIMSAVGGGALVGGAAGLPYVGGLARPLESAVEKTIQTTVSAGIWGITATTVTWVASTLIQVALEVNTSLDVNNPIIQTGFTVTLGIANLGFVIFLVIVGIMTILRKSNWAADQRLINLIIAAIFINFSGFIVQIILSISDAFTNAFLQNNCFAGYFTHAFSFSNAHELVSSIMGVNSTGGYLLASITPLLSTASLAVAAIISIVGSVTALVIFAFLVIRYLILTILIISIPIAWLGYISPEINIPGLGNPWKGWWEQFMKWITIGPIMSFLLYISISIMQNIGSIVDAAALKNAGLIDIAHAGFLSGSIQNILGVLMVILMTLGSPGVALIGSGLGAQLGSFAAGSLKQVGGALSGRVKAGLATGASKLGEKGLPGADLLRQGISSKGHGLGSFISNIPGNAVGGVIMEALSDEGARNAVAARQKLLKDKENPALANIANLPVAEEAQAEAPITEKGIKGGLKKAGQIARRGWRATKSAGRQAGGFLGEKESEHIAAVNLLAERGSLNMLDKNTRDYVMGNLTNYDLGKKPLFMDPTQAEENIGLATNHLKNLDDELAKSGNDPRVKQAQRLQRKGLSQILGQQYQLLDAQGTSFDNMDPSTQASLFDPSVKNTLGPDEYAKILTKAFQKVLPGEMNKVVRSLIDLRQDARKNTTAINEAMAMVIDRGSRTGSIYQITNYQDHLFDPNISAALERSGANIQQMRTELTGMNSAIFDAISNGRGEDITADMINDMLSNATKGVSLNVLFDSKSGLKDSVKEATMANLLAGDKKRFAQSIAATDYEIAGKALETAYLVAEGQEQKTRVTQMMQARGITINKNQAA